MKRKTIKTIKELFSLSLVGIYMFLCCKLLILLGAAVVNAAQHDHSGHLHHQAEESDHSQHMMQMKKKTSGQDVNIVKLQVPDLELLNQDGEKGRFISDFIGDKQVALTFVFTSCTTICPVIDGIFLNLQDQVADRLGKDVSLLTLTVDAARDIPERLKYHTDRIGAKPGWNYLTGELETVKTILQALEVYTPDINNHPPVVFVIDGRHNNWRRLNGFPSATQIKEEMLQNGMSAKSM